VTGKWVREGRAGAEALVVSAARARLERPLGQGKALQHWQQRARRLLLPHALVVEGSRGVGKTVVMQWLTAALLCPSELDEDAPCGVCRTCTRIAAGLHPDVHLVDRAQDEQDKEENKKSYYVIKVDQVRQAQTHLLRHAVEGRGRVLLIADADCMEEEAQNALLKTLEEPGSATFLLLETTRPEQLLPTVRSRVQRLRVLPLDEATIARELLRRFPNQSSRVPDALAVAHGSLGLAALACTERAVQIHDLVHAVLAGNKGLRPVAIARAVLEGTSQRWQELPEARLFLWLLRSEVRRRRDALAAEAVASYPSWSADPWTTWLELTLAAERDLDLLIPPDQVLTACLVGFLVP
jgi:DNA polymerase III subunit delta'